MIRAILACDDDWGIGKDGELPWPYNPADMNWFKTSTLDDVIIMGRNTWDSLPTKPLPDRQNVVVSTTKEVLVKSVPVFHPDNDLHEQINRIADEHEVWIIGGAQLLTSCLDIIEEVWLSRISGSFDCDTFLPKTTIESNFTKTSTSTDNGLTIEVWSAN